MRRVLISVPLALLVILMTQPAASASTTSYVFMTFSEPAQVDFHSGCAVFPDGFCGKGEVIPFGQATETIVFGAGCGGTCDLRTITMSEGQLFLEETAVSTCSSDGCHIHGPIEVVGGTLTDVVVGGTGMFEGATGKLTGTVMGAVSNARPAGASTVKLSGTLRYGP